VRYQVRFARAARDDLRRLTEFLATRDPEHARAAAPAIRDAVEVLKRLPFVGRQALQRPDPALRELVVPFGSTGYVLLYRIGPGALVSVLAARHQRELSVH
jgi:plasmid stabilization system protein ParE